jgi:Asp-tRNA(Asn)/Glu-tRNA(Gln) amidotransferase A subunit family amidase
VEACLARIEDSNGEGRTTFLYVDREAALAQADVVDALRSSGAALLHAMRAFPSRSRTCSTLKDR